MTKYLQSRSGDKSSMRLGFMFCVITGCFGGIGACILDIIMNQGKNIAAIAIVIGAYLTPAFYGKQAQAKAELSTPGKPEK